MKVEDIKVGHSYRDKKGRVRRVEPLSRTGDCANDIADDVRWKPVSGFAKSSKGGQLFVYNMLDFEEVTS